MDTELGCYISGGFAAVFRVARVAGLAPLNFVKIKNGWWITLSLSWSTYGCAMIIILNLLTAASLVIEVRSEQVQAILGWSKTRYSVWTVQVGLMIISSGTAVWMAPGHMKLSMLLFNRIHKINSELNINYWSKSLGSKLTRVVVAQLVICLALSVTDITMNMITYWDKEITVEARNDTLQTLPVLALRFWFFYHTFCLIMIIEPCHATHMEMAQTRELVARLVSYPHSIISDPADMDIELEKLFKYLVLDQVYYMPLNVTTMSRSLVLTILGSLTTYIVVILNI